MAGRNKASVNPYTSTIGRALDWMPDTQFYGDVGSGLYRGLIDPDFRADAAKELTFGLVGAPADMGLLAGGGIPAAIHDYAQNRKQRINPDYEPQLMGQPQPLDYGPTSDSLASAAGMPFSGTGPGNAGRALAAPFDLWNIGKIFQRAGESLGDVPMNTGDMGRQKGNVGGIKAAEQEAKTGNEMPMNALRWAEMERMKGTPADNIWTGASERFGHGIYYDQAGNPIWEALDTDAKLSNKFMQMGVGGIPDEPMRLIDTLEHPNMARMYPDEMANTMVQWSDDLPPGVKGEQQGNMLRIARGTPDPLSVVMHEGTHGIPQRTEGWPKGGSVNEFAVQGSQVEASRQIYEDRVNGGEIVRVLREAGIGRVDDPGFYEAFLTAANSLDMPEDKAAAGLLEQLTGDDRQSLPDLSAAQAHSTRAQRRYDRMAVESVTKQDATKKYLSLAAEEQARAVQKRMNLTQAERAERPISRDFDTPLEDQIVRYGNGPAESAINMPSFAEVFGEATDPKFFKGSSEEMSDGGLTEFLTNPNNDDIRKFFSRADMKDGGVRTTKDADGNLYMWDASKGTHKQFHMGLEDKLDKDINFDQEFWNNQTEQVYPAFDATEIAARYNQGAAPLSTSAERMDWVRGKADRKSAYNSLTENFDGTQQSPTYSASTSSQELPKGSELQNQSGMARGDEGLRPASPEILRPKPLKGLPTTAKLAGQDVAVGPHPLAHQVANDYMRSTGREYTPPTTYAPVDEPRAKRIASAYQEMVHAPSDPKVKEAYSAMIDETLAQWREIEKSGLKVEFIRGDDPYASSPRMAIEDVKNNNHLWVYPSTDGYGQGEISAAQLAENPLLAKTGVTISGQEALANDIFRIVHDYFGHVKEGTGFRATGEENAWRSHSSMYSPLARKAMTSETRGQNSWVNFGPEGELNQTASGAGTTYAEQKIGLLPDWAVEEGATDIKPASLGDYPTSTTGRIKNATAQNQGYSVNLRTGDVPTEGLMMGRYANADPRTLVTDSLNKAAIEKHFQKNQKVLQKPENYFGTWHNRDKGNYYLDVAKKFPGKNLRHATKFGEKTGQLEGYNAKTGKTFPVGNWEKFIETDEFQDRLDLMAGEGNDYMSQFPAKQWWDMHGDSSFNRVYGEENLPQVAGFMGSTAPNAAPTENTRTMTEYMRRHIKKENIIQPDWRVPEGTISRTPGVKIGMEKGRRKNLVLSSQGRYNELGGNKVRSEAQALMGDPGAMVFDRHQVRISEKPSEGTFASTKEGVMPKETKKEPSKLYNKLGDAFKKGAARHNQSPRDFSARVWTGIRETIKRDWELFGEAYQKGSIQGPSKSYADIFDDLIAEKAEFLGITVEEMEQKLRTGDAELLSWLLATPVGMAIYSMVGESDPDSQPGS